MASLVASLGKGKGSWTQLKKLIKKQDWENIILVTNEFGAENFSADKKPDFVVVDTTKDIFELSKDIKQALAGKIKDIEVAINLISGDGKLHMAVISALLKSGLSIRLVDVKEESVEEV